MKLTAKAHVSQNSSTALDVEPETKLSSEPQSEPTEASLTAMEKPERALDRLARAKDLVPASVRRAGNVLAVRLGETERKTRFAAIDLGSSSAKLLVLEQDGSGRYRTLLDRKIGCALGKGVPQGGPIPDANVERATQALATFAAEAEALGVDPASIPVITTAVVRNSSNGADVADRIERAAGLSDIRILSGEEEAQHGYLGALAMLGGAPGRYATLDLGGGSFQLAIGTEAALEAGDSTQIGSNYVLEQLLPKEKLSAEDFAAADAALQTKAPMPLDPAMLEGRALVATGGISKFLRAHFGRDEITAAEIDSLRHAMGALDYDARVPDVQAGKDDEQRLALGIETEQGARDYGIKLTASTTLLLHILRGIGVESVRVSETDARHLLIHRAESLRASTSALT